MSLAEIDEEIRRLAKRIESIQKDVPAGRQQTVKEDQVIKPEYKNLPDLQNVEYPKGFERAPPSHETDRGKAERVASLEAAVRESLLQLNRQDTLVLIRKTGRHQFKNPIGTLPPDTQTEDNLRKRMLSQWLPQVTN